MGIFDDIAKEPKYIESHTLVPIEINPNAVCFCTIGDVVEIQAYVQIVYEYQRRLLERIPVKPIAAIVVGMVERQEGKIESFNDSNWDESHNIIRYLSRTRTVKCIQVRTGMTNKILDVLPQDVLTLNQVKIEKIPYKGRKPERILNECVNG